MFFFIYHFAYNKDAIYEMIKVPITKCYSFYYFYLVIYPLNYSVSIITHNRINYVVRILAAGF